MTTITNLNETSAEELRKLLEVQGITIKKDSKTHFIIECPSCKKSEAFIYYNKGTRTIKCNRENNCGENIELWSYIADKQGIDAHNNFAMLKYINEALGYEFEQKQTESYNAEREERNKEQKFLTDCNQIFFNTLNNSKDNKQVSFSLMYLKDRGYTEESIKQFSLGFFPDYNNLLDSLIAHYSYSDLDAKGLMSKYFEGVLSINGYQKEEEHKNRIVFTWRNHRGDIANFSIRKPTDQDLKPKYININELPKSNLLFNFNNIKKEKNLVVVEGLFDALSPTYFASEEVKQRYDFVAVGQNNITDNQIQLIKNKGYSQVILLLDKDKAGEAFLKSTSRLREVAITPFVASIPEEYQVKDIDELIRKHPEVDLRTILDNPKYAVVAEVEQIIKNNDGARTSIDRDKAVRKCLELKLSPLMSEYEPYRKIMYEKFGVRVEDQEEVTKQEQTTSTTNSDNIKSEIKKLKSDIQLKIQEIEAGEGKHSTIDIHEFRKKSYEIQKLILKDNIAVNKDNSNLKELNDILANIKKYNHLLTTDYEQDTPYTYPAFLEDIKRSPQGLKTGIVELDKHVTIQPSSLVFVAGRPSHGKTTMMLNLCRNMVEANPDKSFLFYSYEENKEDIMLKIILGKTIPDKELNEEAGWTLLEKTKNQLRKYALVFERQGDRTIKTLSANLDKACKEVEKWINEGRLQILTKKPSVEILSSAIIECVQDSEKPVAAIFIDYVQKLNTEEERVNRQQEIQRICQTLLNTSLDKRVNAAIILGAQVNREVKSLDTFNLDNMREAGDIEQDANLVLGVWDEQAAVLDSLQQKLATLDEKTEDIKYGIKEGSLKKINEAEKKLTEKIELLQKQRDSTSKNLKVKILKNRNGQKDVIVNLSSYPDRFLITGINNNHDYTNAAIERVKEMKM